MKLKILILFSVCFVAHAQTPSPLAPPAPAPRRAARSLALATNAAAANATSATTSNTVKIATPLPRVPAMTPEPPSVAQPDKTAAQSPAVAQEEVFSVDVLQFPAIDIEQALQYYAKLVNRTLLRGPVALGGGKISLVAQTPLTKSEAIAAFDAVFGMNGVAMINVGEKFVKVVPTTQANTTGAKVTKGGSAEDLGELGGYITHVVQLRYSKPSEVAPILLPFASTVGASAVFPIETSQILVLRDFTENVKRMLELIKEIDVSVPSEFISEVIPIKYALATDISDALNGLSSGSSGTTIGKSTSRALPGISGGTTTPGNTAYPGGTQPGTVNQGVNTGGTTGIRPGGNTSTFSDRLNAIISRAAKTGGSADFQILGQTKIVADSRTNSLLIFASKQDMEIIKDIIAKLDVVLAQVLIEAIIMEVSLDDSRNVGVSYLQKTPSKAGDFTGIGALLNGKSFPTAQNFVAGGTTGGTNASAGIASGFSYLANIGGDLDVAVTAIAGDNKVNVLSRPRIQTSHAVPASLFIGNTVPYITGTSFNDFGGGGARSQYQEKRVGITLDVLPLINSEGLVVMDIQQQIQQLGAPTTIDNNLVPTTTERSASAKVAVRDGQTIILGGFISSTKSKSKSGVPFLMDIPLLGYLFRSTGEANTRVELIVLMRPTVLPTPEAAALTATIERDKLPGVRRAELDYNKDEAKRLKQFKSSVKKEDELDRKNSGDVHQFEPVEGVK